MVDYREELDNMRFLVRKHDDMDNIPHGELTNFTEEYRNRIVRYALYGEYLECQEVEKETRSQRHVWYSIKPFLGTHLEDAGETGWADAATDAFYDQFSMLVQLGIFSYKDFYVRDSSRPREHPSFHRKYPTGSFDNTVVFVEKDAEWPYIKPLADLLKIDIECGTGQQSTAVIEETAERITERTEGGSEDWQVLCLTDYDYYGFLIVESLRERFRKFNCNADVIRVGLNPEQVPARAKGKMFPIRKENAAEREWAGEYALGEDGNQGYELEALKPDEVRRIVATAIYKHCDVNKLYEYRKKKGWSELSGVVVGGLVQLQPEYELITKAIKQLSRRQHELVNKLKEQIEPEVDKYIDEHKERLDSRPDFPEKFLYRKIANGTTYIGDSKYRSVKTNDIDDYTIDLLKSEDFNVKFDVEDIIKDTINKVVNSGEDN